MRGRSMSDLSDEPESIISSARAKTREEIQRMLQQKMAAEQSSSESGSASLDPDELIQLARRSSTVVAGVKGKNQKTARLDAFNQEKLAASLKKAKQAKKKEEKKEDKSGAKRELNVGQDDDDDERGVILDIDDDDDDEDEGMIEVRVELEEEEEMQAVLNPESSSSGHRTVFATETAAQENAERTQRVLRARRKAQHRDQTHLEAEDVEATAIMIKLRDCATNDVHNVKVKPTDRWGDVADKVCQSLRVARDDVDFRFDALRLDDRRTVDECLLGEFDEVEMRQKEEYKNRLREEQLARELALEREKEEEEKEDMWLKLRDAGGTVTRLSCEPGDTLADVLERFKEKMPHYRGKRLKVEFDGDRCSEASTLEQLGLENEDMVEVTET